MPEARRIKMPDEKVEKTECKDEGKKCCCCFGKVVMIILVFLVGGIIGFLKGQCCCHHRMGCGMHMPPHMEAGAMPAPLPKGR
jgi:hypothetical protein